MEKRVFAKPLRRFAILTWVLAATGLPAWAQEAGFNEEQNRVKVDVPANATARDQEKAADAAEPSVRLTQITTMPAPAQPDDSRMASNVSGLSAPSAPAPVAPHPLDRAIEIANGSLTKMRTDVKDYTGLFYRRECLNGVKGDPGYVQLKIRCPRQTETEHVPFSIYMKFLKPRQSAGRECIWVDGANESKIIAHEARGLIGMRRFYLEPKGMIAMRESRYPIYEAGLENLIKKLIEKAARDRAAGPCEAVYKDNCEVNGRKCSMIQVTHKERKEPYDFHVARVFIDDATHLPLAYAAYDWPTNPGEKPTLIEEYHYLNLKTNVGLTSHDFSADNPTYGYPKR